MGLFRRAVAPAVEGRSGAGQWVMGPSGPIVVGVGNGPTTGGQFEQAARNAGAWACMDVLVDTIQRTPFDAVIKRGNARLPVTPEPVLIANPSGLVEADVWAGQLAASLVTDGNAFGQIVDTDVAGFPTQIEWLNPTAVGDRRVEDGKIRVTVGREKQQVWPHGDIVHIPGRFVPPGTPFAVSPLEMANKTLGTSLQAQEYISGFFAGGGHPTALIRTDQQLNEEQAQQLKDRVMAVLRGPLFGGVREPLVGGSGLEYEPIQTSPGDTQFLELMRFSIEQACRFWRVPPSMVYLAMSGSSVTYQNITDSDLQLLKYSIDGYLVRIERRWGAWIPGPTIVRANRDAVLRSDPAKRRAIYTADLANKTESVNSIRALEDKPPWDDPIFDLPGVPATPTGGTGTGDDPTRSLTEMIQKVYLGVNSVITSDEARQILNQAGAELKVPGPTFNE